MNVYDTIIGRRSIRRFKQNPIPYAVLKKYVNVARVAPSAGNLQPLEYIIVDKDVLLAKVFATLKWANYLEGWNPLDMERPVAYILILMNSEICPRGGEYDVGMAAENIILSALEEGIAACCVGSINKGRLGDILRVPDKYDIELVISLGYPNEKSIAEDMENGSIRYWRDEKENIHVPKRNLDKILHRNIF